MYRMMIMMMMMMRLNYKYKSNIKAIENNSKTCIDIYMKTEVNMRLGRT